MGPWEQWVECREEGAGAQEGRGPQELKDVGDGSPEAPEGPSAADNLALAPETHFRSLTRRTVS